MSKRFFLTICLLLTAVSARANELLEMPGRLYDIGELRLHMTCMGTGKPTVIFDAGLGGFSLEWIQVQRRLTDVVQTCAYDRAGYAWSDMGPSPRTTSQIVSELEQLLKVAGLQPPYILVGHSFGGYNVQYYAKMHPDQVAGVILVDSSHPDQADRLPEVKVEERHGGGTRLVTFFNDTGVLEKYPEDVRDTAMMLMSSRKGVVTQQREMTNFTYSGDEVIFLGDDFPDVPLVVVTRGRQEWPNDPLGKSQEKQWLEMQNELAALNEQGHHVFAEQSGHMVHLDQPELIADVLRDMVARQCAGAGSAVTLNC